MPKQEKEDPSVLHLFIYRKIKEKSQGHRFITHASFLEVLRRGLHKVPRRLHYVIIDEMEERNLIRKLDRQKYELIGGEADKSLNKYIPFYN